MLALVALVASIGALDSLNPSTIAPALVLATGAQARRSVAAFTFGVFTVSTAGGLVLLFGPARILLPSIAKPSPHVRHLVEAITGAVLLAVAAALWKFRRRVWRSRRDVLRGVRSSGLAGAAIMAVELPTAFPYFAALLAVAEGGGSAAWQASLVLLYNVVFVAPLLGVLLLVLFGGPRSEEAARRVRRVFERYAPVVVPAGIAIVGVVLLAVGAAQLPQ
jgi:cytochrome c biogenesis protein CcdA